MPQLPPGPLTIQYEMKSVLLSLLAAAALTSSLHAQTSVWKVTQGDSVLYLGGTCHVLRPSDLPLPPEYDQAYAAAKTVVFETDLARMQSPEMQQVVMQRGMFTDGTTLEQALSPEAWTALQKYCEQRQFPIDQLRPMRPWLLTVMLAVIELQKLGVSQQGADSIYFQRAKADAKGIGELETFERQVDYITGMAGDRPSELVLNSLADLDQLPKEFPELIAAWRKGDLATLEQLMNRDLREKYPELHQKLLVERNNAWLPVIEKLLATPDVEFVLAGVGHMSGPEGIVARLRERGCKVEQVTAA
ncbi:MAG TPA: TraB/GumN family protein, partial [Acidobacteriota bacterium]|nr:TraB/GumN family protein [Acidobacteriota bacterium]